MDDVFEELSRKLNLLPEQIKNAYQTTVIEEVDADAKKLEKHFIANSGSETLNSHMVTKATYIKDQVYVRTVDWDDKTVANVLKGKSYGRDASKERPRGKRNYSIRPATVHDLAYIINYGQLNPDGSTKRLGTYFITKGMRKIKNRERRIEKNFNIKLKVIAKNFD